ncbi:sulfatase [Nitriliruptoria bacterium AS10]|nr:sulfatase [Salsipaludibacter albus]MBY5161936.1 sulfatase [Salsipaludibacter albus]
MVLMLADDHAAHAISCYGSVVTTTPRIDEVAANGWRVDNCFVTNSLCAPSRASILTGTHSHVNGVRTLSTPIDATQPMFTDRLRDAGYRVAIIGKWHLGHGGAHDPQHFDHWEVLEDQGEYVDPTFLSASGRRVVPGYATDVITDLAMEWVEGLPDDRPWCVLVWHKAPHRPWVPKEEDRARRREPVPVPATFDDDLAGRSASVRRTTMRIADHLTREDLGEDPPAGLSPDAEAVWKYQRFMQDYLACVDAIDDNVGRVIDWLRERGEFDDTLLAYSSDQGFFLGDHGWFDKRLMFEESIRMPLVLSCPSLLDAGRVHDGLVTNVDWARTLCEAAGVPPHPRMQGRSFWGDLVDGPGEPPAGGVYHRYWEHDDGHHHGPAHYGWRTRRHKLVHYYNDGLGLPGTGDATHPAEWELYDLQDDPEELHNLADDPDHADLRADLEVALWREQARLGDRPHPDQPTPAGLDEPPRSSRRRPG